MDKDGSGSLTMDEAKRIAFEHYGFDEKTLTPFFAQADENEDGQLDAVEFAGFRSVIRSRAIKNAVVAMQVKFSSKLQHTEFFLSHLRNGVPTTPLQKVEIRWNDSST